ncbi:MAG: PD-(D/E)XK nuclease domain-containing protein [Desulfovibrionaceae bacterium]|nr:PD-(D/E)XK nuclease domain-containing protein [Desulfovibrionaceae bacterium]
MLLRGAGIHGFGEVASSKERADILIQTDKIIMILEFKLSRNTKNIDSKIKEIKRQMQQSGYLEPYQLSDTQVISGIVVINDKLHKAILEIIN